MDIRGFVYCPYGKYSGTRGGVSTPRDRIRELLYGQGPGQRGNIHSAKHTYDVLVVRASGRPQSILDGENAIAVPPFAATKGEVQEMAFYHASLEAGPGQLYPWVKPPQDIIWQSDAQATEGLDATYWNSLEHKPHPSEPFMPLQISEQHVVDSYSELKRRKYLLHFGSRYSVRKVKRKAHEAAVLEPVASPTALTGSSLLPPSLSVRHDPLGPLQASVSLAYAPLPSTTASIPASDSTSPSLQESTMVAIGEPVPKSSRRLRLAPESVPFVTPCLAHTSREIALRKFCSQRQAVFVVHNPDLSDPAVVKATLLGASSIFFTCSCSQGTTNADGTQIRCEHVSATLKHEAEALLSAGPELQYPPNLCPEEVVQHGNQSLSSSTASGSIATKLWSVALDGEVTLVTLKRSYKCSRSCAGQGYCRHVAAVDRSHHGRAHHVAPPSRKIVVDKYFSWDEAGRVVSQAYSRHHPSLEFCFATVRRHKRLPLDGQEYCEPYFNDWHSQNTSSSIPSLLGSDTGLDCCEGAQPEESKYTALIVGQSRDVAAVHITMLVG